MNAPTDTPERLSLSERCKLFCEYPGGSPCALSNCPRLKEQTKQIIRDAQYEIGVVIRECLK